MLSNNQSIVKNRLPKASIDLNLFVLYCHQVTLVEKNSEPRSIVFNFDPVVLERIKCERSPNHEKISHLKFGFSEQKTKAFKPIAYPI